MKRKAGLGAALTVGILFLSGCREALEVSVGNVQTQKESAAEQSGPGRYELTDNDYNTEATDAVEIDLSRLNETQEETYGYEERRLTVHEAGSYVITGKMNGSIYVKVFDDEVVHLFLKNAEIKAEGGSAVYVENAAKVIITAVEGTENILSAMSKQEKTRQACIFSNSDLTLNGGGRLSVYGYRNDGVRSRDRLKIVNTNLYVKAEKDAVRGNDGVIIRDSITEAECEGTGILSDSDKDMVILEGGSLKVIAGKHAISARRYVSVQGTGLDLYSVLEKIRCDGIRELDEDSMISAEDIIHMEE